MHIISTISIDIHKEQQIRSIISAGGDIFRYNFAYGTTEKILEHIQLVRKIAIELNKPKVAIMADLPGDKVRITKLSAKDKIVVQRGQEILISVKENSLTNNKNCLYINNQSFFDKLKMGIKVIVADGELALEISGVKSKFEAKAIALNSGIIFPNKSLMFPEISTQLEVLTNKALDCLSIMDRFVPEWIAISFATPKNLKHTRKILDSFKDKSWKPRIAAKIETQKSTEHIPEICKYADMIVVARGDLGILCPIEKLGVLQKRIIRDTKAFGKKVIIATQILDSSVHRYIPQRAEVLDLTNIVLDEADGIMLANETVSNKNPEIPVKLARKVIKFVNSNL